MWVWMSVRPSSQTCDRQSNLSVASGTAFQMFLCQYPQKPNVCRRVCLRMEIVIVVQKYH